MASELPEPMDIARHSVLSLVNGDEVNGLGYHKTVVNIELVGGGDSTTATATDDVNAPIMLLYYPTDTITEGAYSVGVQLQPGIPPADGLIETVLSRGYDQRARHQFIQSPATSLVVDFAREAHRETVPLIEMRDSLLREYQAPLAAVAIYRSGNVCSVTIATPYFVWPWAAFAEMEESLRG